MASSKPLGVSCRAERRPNPQWSELFLFRLWAAYLPATTAEVLVGIMTVVTPFLPLHDLSVSLASPFETRRSVSSTCWTSRLHEIGPERQIDIPLASACSLEPSSAWQFMADIALICRIFILIRYSTIHAKSQALDFRAGGVVFIPLLYRPQLLECRRTQKKLTGRKFRLWRKGSGSLLHYRNRMSPLPTASALMLAHDSEFWLLEHADLSSKKRAAFCALQSGVLSALCYPAAPSSRLRVVADYMNYLFKLDDWSDELTPEQVDVLRGRVMQVLYDPSPFVNKAGDDPVALLTASFFSRLVSSAGPLCVARFVSTMEDFFDAVTQQAHDRICDSVPSLQTYIALRRDTSGCRPCFALVEYAAGIDLPHSIAKHPCAHTMEDAANDVVSFANDIYSFNVEQARGDTHNAVIIVMREQGLDIQDALNHVGDLCIAAIQTFERTRAQIPSTGTRMDADLDAYIAGLQDWMVGSLHWSFITERYFGAHGLEVKKGLKVKLLPQKAQI
ncbi:hypothetical protein EVG20_g568 [Dentipellis fragilis]|uniref:Terpene synthase n=1 Tax=Dentipellis fragilis TaxID=205917 RepID=A0A4Y9ZGA7_9AGAM|nr:hypothetical protein EVG20_g568 [Dentipellis fragilis]